MAGERKYSDFTARLSDSTYADAANLENLPESPIRPRDCYLVIKKIEEKTAIPGFSFAGELEYEKDREIDGVVLAAGPGYRVMTGVYPKTTYSDVVANSLKRGDIVHFLERSAHQVFLEGEKYYLLEEHRANFVVEPSDSVI